MTVLLPNSLVPFHVEMRRLYRDPDTFHHELSFGVVGVEEPAVVILASDCYREPVIVERLGRGGLELRDRLIDSLAIHCFRLLSDLIIDHGGESGWWTLPDATTWVRQGFPQADAEKILLELSRHVEPGFTVRSACLVADDDAI